MRHAVWLLALALVPSTFAFPKEVIKSASSDTKCVRLLILPNRFTQAQLAQDRTTSVTVSARFWEPGVTDGPSFQRCAATAVEGIFAREPFASYKAAFKVTRMDVPSAGDQVGQGYFPEIVRKTFISGWDKLWGNSTEQIDKLHDLTSAEGADSTLVVVNEKKHEGYAFPKINVVLYDNDRATFAYTCAHEAGHSVLGLADEYDETRPWNLSEAMGNYSGSPNVDFTPTLANAKWARWSNQSPGIGCLPGGAGYAPNSPIYHPTPNCMMNRDTVGGCCVVCREAGVARIFAKVDLISEVRPSNEQTVRIAAGGQQNFAIQTPYGGPQGLSAEWLLDGVNLSARAGRPSVGGGDSILSLTVTAADLKRPGDHTLQALVRDTRAHPRDTRPAPAERTWRIVLEGQPDLKQR